MEVSHSIKGHLYMCCLIIVIEMIGIEIDG